MSHAHTQDQAHIQGTQGTAQCTAQGTAQGTAQLQEPQRIQDMAQGTSQDRSLPVEIQRLIYEFARPLTRPDWKRCRGSIAELIRRMNQTTVFHFYMPMDFTLPELSLYDRLCFLGRLKERT